MLTPPTAGFSHDASEELAFGAEQLEATLQKFRQWHADLASSPQSPTVAEPFAIAPLVAQLVALRHDANLQTKAYRAMSEKLAQTLDTEPTTAPDPSSVVRPLAKLLLDVHDALSAALRQIRISEAGLVSLPQLPDLEPTPTPRRWWQFFGGEKRPSNEYPESLLEWLTDHEHATQKLGDQLRGISSGYEMSLKRIERTLPEFDFERIDCLHTTFDPAVCEVLDTIISSDHPPGTVVEIVREGYRWRGELFRFAQVKVTIS